MDPWSVLEEFFKVLWRWWVNVATSDLIELWDVWRCSLDFGTFMGFLTFLEIPEGSPVGVWDSYRSLVGFGGIL